MWDIQLHGIPGGMGDTEGTQGGVLGPEFLTGPSPSPGAAESHTAQQEPGENHKSRGYMRAFSLAVFDRDTKFNFLQRALNPRLSLAGGCSQPQHRTPPCPGVPQHPQRGFWGHLGCSFGDIEVNPKAGGVLVPAAPRWFLSRDGFGAREIQNLNCLASTPEVIKKRGITFLGVFRAFKCWSSRVERTQSHPTELQAIHAFHPRASSPDAPGGASPGRG